MKEVNGSICSRVVYVVVGDVGTVPTRKPLCRRRRETRSVGNVVSRKRLKLVYNTGETMEDYGCGCF